MHFNTLHSIAAAVFIIIFANSPSADSADTAWNIPVIQSENGDCASFYDIARSGAGVGFSFDPVLRRGRFFRKEHQVIFMEGYAAALADGKIIRADHPVMHSRNETLIPEDLFIGLMAILFPELHIDKKNGRYCASSGKIMEKPKEVNPESADDQQKMESEDRENTVQKKNISSATAEKISFIVLDAGHGGKDPGAIGKGKIYEKNITLSVIKKLGSILGSDNKGIKIYYTRSSDVFVELGGRTEIANRKLTNKAGGIFVSIHVNASVVPKMNGFETYYLSQNPSNSEARSTAALENNVVVLENPGRRKSYDDVEYIEALMATTQIQKESRMLAETIQSRMASVNKEFPSRGVKTADFFVLRGSLMPAVLIEIGYITNAKEAARLTNDAYQDKVAASVAKGIEAFLRTYSGSN